MKKSFWLPIALGLWPISCSRCRGARAPCPIASRRSSTQIERGQAEGGRAHHDDPELSAPASTGSRVRSRPPRSELDRAQSSLDRQKNELLEVRDRLEGARDRLARLRSELATARAGARRPARGDLQVGHPGRADGGAGVRRVRRPARARRVPRAHLRPGPRDHRPRARPARQAQEPGGAAGQAGAARAAGRRAHPPASATRSPRRRTSSCRRATSWRRRAPTSRACSPRCAPRSRTARRTSPRSQAEQARVAGALQGARRRPIKQGSGQLIWPVNGPVTGAVRRVRPGHFTRASTSPSPRARRSARPTPGAWR